MLTGLRSAPRGDVRIRIRFAIDADGIVQVTAEDTDSGNQVDMMVRASSRMSDTERETHPSGIGIQSGHVFWAGNDSIGAGLFDFVG